MEMDGCMSSSSDRPPGGADGLVSSADHVTNYDVSSTNHNNPSTNDDHHFDTIGHPQWDQDWRPHGHGPDGIGGPTVTR